MKNELKKSLYVAISFILIDFVMLVIFMSIDFSMFNLVYLGLAIFAEIAIIGAILIYEINKKEF